MGEIKKIGFIDYFLDEWHADNIPAWIEQASGGRMKVAYAYGKIDSPSGQSNADWCAKKGIELLDSIEAVIKKSDYLIVLSPDYPEQHEELCQLPLRSGKPTYIDKTFAPDRRTALRLFDIGMEHGTPMYSSSALRYASEYEGVDRSGIETIASMGPGGFGNYAIHQLEPIVMLMGTQVRRVMFTGTAHTPALLIGFADGRQASIQHFGWECPFSMAINYASGNAKLVKVESDYFQSFIRDLVAFFDSGKPSVDPAETVAIMKLIEYGKQAAAMPYEWIELPI